LRFADRPEFKGVGPHGAKFVEVDLEAPRLERRLIAILAADVEGYSRHLERDEVATLAPCQATA
jgi:class 3 adenylate cyclase